ncbi:Protein of unknown function [Geodermatophilus telluris]|uniref:DUF3152 domain-containing protein n=1 Tax=Geodermatophilus telluris TaxID=1190417 RepID=A0A1G6ID67_9ACTN|nr:DUF3152 domain-containing protein [Geodermatophilus telluris]SDC04350.1 Protein of unknown function [Geodermatophilus telluris]
MAALPPGGDRGPERVRGLPRVPPPPPRAPRPARGPATGPTTGGHRPAGPLVARRDPLAGSALDGARRPATGPPPRRRPAGRVRRFVARYGWRAYAIPLLAVATVLALVDLGVSGHGGQPASAEAGSEPTDTPPATAEPSASTPEASPTAPAEGDAGPTDLPPATAAATYVEQGAGSVSVVPGTSAVYGTGPLQRFVVEVEDGIGVDGAAFAAAVEATLGDPRSWGSGGRMSFQRVDTTEAGGYEFRVSLVSPGSMERYCPGVGTGGYTSCRYGERAVINLARWATAVPHYDGDVATYRQYVVNHEVGHALGNGHEDCPGPGLPAPVMQQQTLGLEGCTRNAWPFP